MFSDREPTDTLQAPVTAVNRVCPVYNAATTGIGSSRLILHYPFFFAFHAEFVHYSSNQDLSNQKMQLETEMSGAHTVGKFFTVTAQIEIFRFIGLPKEP